MTSRFHSLTDTIMKHEELWRARPFACRVLPWARSLPDVEHALLQLNDEQLALCQTNPRLLPQWVPGLRDLVDWWEDELDEPPTGQEEPAPLPQMRGVPARKQEQISRFIHTLFEHCTPASEELWVEWCAGKGYLARALQHMAGARVRCLERSSRILRSGAKHRGKQDLEFRAESIRRPYVSNTTPKTLRRASV